MQIWDAWRLGFHIYEDLLLLGMLPAPSGLKVKAAAGHPVLSKISQHPSVDGAQVENSRAYFVFN